MERGKICFTKLEVIVKKFAIVLALFLAILYAGICVAAESQHLSTKPKQVLVDSNGDGKIDGVDIYDENGKVVKRGYDDNGDMKVERWETYDENTGLPVVVASDKEYLLQ